MLHRACRGGTQGAARAAAAAHPAPCSATAQRRYSVAKIETSQTYEKGRPKLGGLSDPRLGTMDRALKCTTDGNGVLDCPGYFGHIELAKPMFHIHFLKTVVKVLRCVSYHNSKIMVLPVSWGVGGAVHSGEGPPCMGARRQRGSSCGEGQGQPAELADRNEGREGVAWWGQSPGRTLAHAPSQLTSRLYFSRGGASSHRHIHDSPAPPHLPTAPEPLPPCTPTRRRTPSMRRP